MDTVAHEVETMFSAREVPWHGLGVITESELNAADALKTAGLDWTVEKEPCFLAVDPTNPDSGFIEVPNKYITVRQSDRAPLGVVGEDYRIMDNYEAFAFTDNLIGEGAHYSTAGSLFGGRRVFMTAILNEQMVAGDLVRNYLVLTNSHDGASPAKAMLSPTRVVCANTLRIAISGAVHSWSIRHTKNLMDRYAEAQRALQISSVYTDALKAKAEEMALVKISPLVLSSFITDLFDGAKKAGERHWATQKKLDDFMLRLDAPDLANHKGTMWGVYQALTDHNAHRTSISSNPNWKENRFVEVMEDSPWLETATKKLLALV